MTSTTINAQFWMLHKIKSYSLLLGFYSSSFALKMKSSLQTLDCALEGDKHKKKISLYLSSHRDDRGICNVCHDSLPLELPKSTFSLEEEIFIIFKNIIAYMKESSCFLLHNQVHKIRKAEFIPHNVDEGNHMCFLRSEHWMLQNLRNFSNILVIESNRVEKFDMIKNNKSCLSFYGCS